jgi:DNA end-binding protein Ku
MHRADKAALGRYSARGKQYLVLIRALGPRLVLQQLFYADEVRSPEEIQIDAAELKEPEIQLALQLIEQTASTDGFHPERYQDSVKQRVEEAIERKIAGQDVQATMPAPQAQIIDLMEALKASIGGRRPAASPAPESESESAARKPAKRAPREATKRRTAPRK